MMTFQFNVCCRTCGISPFSIVYVICTQKKLCYSIQGPESLPYVQNTASQQVELRNQLPKVTKDQFKLENEELKKNSSY
jgi:hypothetical protein